MTDIQKINISELIPDSRNGNKGTERGRYMLERSLDKLGVGRSVLIDKNNRLIAGNKTHEVAGAIGIEDVIVVRTDGKTLVAVQRTDLDLEQDEEARELAWADNRVQQVSFDVDLGQLQADLDRGIDLSDFYQDDEINALLGAIASEPLLNEEEDEENTADLIDKAESGQIESRVKNGDIWACGRHRVCCGDSTDGGVIKALLGDRKVSFVWSDPPYGISVVSDRGDGQGSVGASVACSVGVYAQIIGDETIDTAVNSYRLINEVARDAVQVIWGGNYYAHELEPSSCWIIWDKRDDMPSNNFADAELAWTNQSSPARVFRHLWNGMIKASEQGQKRIHPTQKPIALAEWCFEKYGDRNDLIFDPFLGSGMSIMAAQKMEGDRTVYGCELSEQYCELILRRFEAFTGQVAQLVGSV